MQSFITAEKYEWLVPEARKIDRLHIHYRYYSSEITSTCHMKF